MLYVGSKRRTMTLALLGISVLIVLAFSATGAFAHVRWFVDANVSVENFVAFNIADPEVLIWIAISFALVGTSIVLDTKLPNVRIVGRALSDKLDGQAANP